MGFGTAGSIRPIRPPAPPSKPSSLRPNTPSRSPFPRSSNDCIGMDGEFYGDPAMNIATRHSGFAIHQLPYETDQGLATRAAIGLVVLASDQTIEYEFRKIVDLPGVAFYES